MASGQWQINSLPAVATQATVGQATASTTALLVNRLRSLTAMVSTGATAQTPLTVVVRDGATGAGTVIWSGSVAAPVDGSCVITQGNLDLRSSSGNAITIEFTAAGVAASQLSVSAQGDTVPAGYPAFGP